MINWKKRAEKIEDIIKNISELSTDFIEISGKIQQQISIFENKTPEKDEKIDNRLLPALRKLQGVSQNFNSIASSASIWFLDLRRELERMPIFFEKIETIEKDYEPLKSSENKEDAGKIDTLMDQLSSAERDINSLSSDLKSKEMRARVLINNLFSHAQTYLKELSSFGMISSAVARLIGRRDINKHVGKLSKAISDYVSA